MMYERTKSHLSRGPHDVGRGESVAVLREVRRMQRKRRDLPTIEEFNLYAVVDVDYERGVERFETLPELRPSAEYERLPKVQTATGWSGRSIVPGGRYSFYTDRRGWWRRLWAWVTRGDDHDSTFA